MKKIIPLILLALFAPTFLFAAEVKEIAPKKVYDLLKEGSGLWLIDVRGPHSFDKGHIEGAVNIPQSTLAVKRFPKNKLLILADNSLGQTQARAAVKMLLESGQERVFLLKGGIGGWQREGLPIVSSGDNWELVQVRPGEFQRAVKGQAALQVYDLRDGRELEQGMIDGSVIISGESIENRLQELRRRLQQERKGPAAELKRLPTKVVVFPISADARTLYLKYLWNLPGDIRVLEGGYAAWNAPQGKQSISSGDGCATCPGG